MPVRAGARLLRDGAEHFVFPGRYLARVEGWRGRLSLICFCAQGPALHGGQTAQSRGAGSFHRKPRTYSKALIVKWAIVGHNPRMAEAATDEKLDDYINATANGAIDPTAVEHVKEALRLIAGGVWPTHERALRLMALRRYLRYQGQKSTRASTTTGPGRQEAEQNLSFRASEGAHGKC